MLPCSQKNTTHQGLSCIKAAHAIKYIRLQSIKDDLSAPRYIMPMIVSSYQHCDKQKFQRLSCVHYTIFTVVKLDIFIQTELLDQILFSPENTMRTPLVHFILNPERHK